MWYIVRTAPADEERGFYELRERHMCLVPGDPTTAGLTELVGSLRKLKGGVN